jgi:RNA polymerase sigma-70 factor, ECF subfamily
MSRPVQPDPEEFFIQLYRRYQPQILAYTRRRLPEADAVEAVAEAFLAAWRHLDSVPDEPLPWLYRIAGNTAANQWRRSSRWGRLQDRVRTGFPHPTSPDPAVAIVGNDALATALAALSEADREVLRLAAWEGLDGAELAQALGCRIGTAKVRLHRARQRLARLLTSSDPTTFETATEVHR